jgi:3-oxoadipate enol-lactonase
VLDSGKWRAYRLGQRRGIAERKHFGFIEFPAPESRIRLNHREAASMAANISRRGLLRIAGETTAALGVTAMAGELSATSAMAQSGPNNDKSKGQKPAPTVSVGSGVQLFHREDWLGEPWVTPEPILLIHGVGESGLAWFGWVPRMSREFRVLRPDTPGFGQSTAPRDYDWTLANLAKAFAGFLDAMEIDSAHIVGAKLGGAMAMQFAADYPRRTRTLVLAGAPVSTPVFNNTTAEVLDKKWVTDTQHDRLGSAATKDEMDYWNKMMSVLSPETQTGINKVTAALSMDSVLPRIMAPTLVITTDRSSLQSVETVIRYQRKIPNSRLLVLTSDAYHVAVAKADECVTNALSFIKQSSPQRA